MRDDRAELALTDQGQTGARIVQNAMRAYGAFRPSCLWSTPAGAHWHDAGSKEHEGKQSDYRHSGGRTPATSLHCDPR